MLQRRGFLTGLVSALAAPAIVRASSLMPVRTMIWAPPVPPLIGIDCGSTAAITVAFKYEYDKALRTIKLVQVKHTDFYKDPGIWVETR
jgi:hypothetical protein